VKVNLIPLKEKAHMPKVKVIPFIVLLGMEKDKVIQLEF
jgi:hypothetical protein